MCTFTTYTQQRWGRKIPFIFYVWYEYNLLTTVPAVQVTYLKKRGKFYFTKIKIRMIKKLYLQNTKQTIVTVFLSTLLSSKTHILLLRSRDAVKKLIKVEQDRTLTIARSWGTLGQARRSWHAFAASIETQITPPLPPSLFYISWERFQLGPLL
jgi:hypothetical protein